MTRSKWKGIHINITKNTINRNTTINLSLLGKIIKIHNGKNIKKIKVNHKMLGYKTGYFIKTKQKVNHKKK